MLITDVHLQTRYGKGASVMTLNNVLFLHSASQIELQK
jgi:hypothetical protein